MKLSNNSSLIRKILSAKRQKAYVITFSILGVIFIFAIWWIIAACLNNSLFPTPIEAFRAFGELFVTNLLWASIGSTLLRLLISFFICLVVAILLGLLAGRFKYFRTFLSPLIIILRTLPTAAVIYALVVIMKPAYAIQILLFLLMFPIIYQAVVMGIQELDKDVINSVKMDMNIMDLRSVTHVILPGISANAILGCIQSLGLGMKVAIMAEVLVGTNAITGIGRLIYIYFNNYNEMDKVFAVSIYAIILIAIIDISLHLVKKKFLNKNK